MKATDLIIGDWVLPLNDPEKRPVKVDVDLLTWINEYPIEPIPLTEEILKANGLGFKRHNEGYDEWEIQIDSYSSWFVMCITHYIDGAGDWYIEDMPIHYVHELQHALRFCELNELADNLKIE